MGPITYAAVFRDPLLADGQGMITATTNGEIIGALRWDYYAEPPVVLDISVDERFRRQGIATRLFAEAKTNESQLVHSDTLTPDGAAFVAALPRV